MIVPDANLLLYAYDRDSPFHDAARNWWQSRLSGDEPVGLTHPVIFAFLRIGTSARAFDNPMTLAEAADHIRSWLDRHIVQILQPPTSHIEQVVGLLTECRSAGGNLVTDAQIAALALAYKAVVHTADRDFMRFAGVRCHYPLDVKS